jgi:hypothetical protein
MSVVIDLGKGTELFEQWLGARLRLIPADLSVKHRMMARALFPFFRATFYRWMQVWGEEAGELSKAEAVLSVGDLHVENFGTWRDVEGRLVWGVNDFDEAYPLPWTHDLVRLATSAHFAIAEGRLVVTRGDACNAIIDGYTHALHAGGRPFVLAERHGFLRNIALSKARAPKPFWEKLSSLPDLEEPAPDSALAAIRELLPGKDMHHRVVHRISGLGSLGRERYVAIGEWHGAVLAREAKAVAPSSCVWAKGEPTEPQSAQQAARDAAIFCQDLLDSAVRSPDPFVRVNSHWVVRRLAPDCVRINLRELPEKRDEYQLLWSMGYETGNIHLGTKGARTTLLHELRNCSPHWLHLISKRMAKRTKADWASWRLIEAARPLA